MIDEKSGLLAFVTAMERSTNEGTSWLVSLTTVVNAFDIASPLAFLVTTPNTGIRIYVQAHGCANTPANLEIFEDTGVLAQFNVTGGTAFTPINKNRNSANVSTVTVTHTPTITAVTADALILGRHVGKSGGHLSHGIVLKQNTKYLFRLVSLEDNNEGSLNLDWLERVDRRNVNGFNVAG